MPARTKPCARCGRPFACEARRAGHGREPVYCRLPDCAPPVGAPEPPKPPRAAEGQGHPSTCEREYSDEELELLRAAEAWKKLHRRNFVAVCDVLKILRGLGYRKCGDEGEKPRTP